MSQLSNSSIDLLVILGPTATGKTKLAVQLADKLSGGIISADSRQVYRGMDIGTGKDLEEYELNGHSIPYHLIDIADPMEEYNVAQFQQDFKDSFSDIHKQHKQQTIYIQGNKQTNLICLISPCLNITYVF